MKIAIVGSRRRSSMKDRYQVFGLVERLVKEYPDLVIVSGGCRKGADAFAEEAARAYGVPKAIHPVDTSGGVQNKWDFTQKAYSRNYDIAEDAEKIYAWVSDDRMGGTENTIGHGLNLKREIYLVTSDGSVYLSRDGSIPPNAPIMRL